MGEDAYEKFEVKFSSSMPSNCRRVLAKGAISLPFVRSISYERPFVWDSVVSQYNAVSLKAWSSDEINQLGNSCFISSIGWEGTGWRHNNGTRVRMQVKSVWCLRFC